MDNEMKSLLLEMAKDMKDLKQDVSGLKQDVSELKQDVAELKQGQLKLEKRLDVIETNQAIFEKAVMDEFTKLNSKIGDIEYVTKSNTYEIELLKRKAN